MMIFVKLETSFFPRNADVQNHKAAFRHSLQNFKNHFLVIISVGKAVLSNTELLRGEKKPNKHNQPTVLKIGYLNEIC